MIAWQLSAFDELTPRQLYAVCAARAAVFVVEQSCAYQDLDGYDLAATHLIAWSDAEIAGYLRLLEPCSRFAEASIGRVLTAAAFRRTGLGRELMSRALGIIDERYRTGGTRISAQSYLHDFYASFGFRQVSEPYLEDGIPHMEMLRA